MPEERRIFTDLTVEENLEVGRQPTRDGHGAPYWTIERLVALFPNLAELRQRLGGRISGGEQQMLTIARTLMGNPLLLLLDEPSEGLAPMIVENMAETIRSSSARASPSCCRSRICVLPKASPTAPTSSKRAACATSVRCRRCSPTRPLSRRISAHEATTAFAVYDSSSSLDRLIGEAGAAALPTAVLAVGVTGRATCSDWIDGSFSVP